jgi:hypothetical protein
MQLSGALKILYPDSGVRGEGATETPGKRGRPGGMMPLGARHPTLSGPVSIPFFVPGRFLGHYLDGLISVEWIAEFHRPGFAKGRVFAIPQYLRIL